ncbi:oligoendopeptidase F [Hujiaoplasma nucleasis]|uniref:Oligopeptidase F n=1 Tax=Hujiaoplasma nucleasis TaxID=2725268 RepID=A0A7L6MZM7_9MOLU|nr:oligoendopeptidase F [Hujiaoplasma nucleasis]QLY39446.1 oligoendopeptidase F [Hujiaoplasma nucleasis]
MKWDLTYHFKNDQDFEKAFEETVSIIDKLASFKGKLGNEKDFKAYFDLQKQFEETGLRVYQFASLSSDLNKKDSEKAARLQKVQLAFAKLQQAVSFEEPELISIGQEKVMKFIEDNNELHEYRFAMEKLFRRQEHILDDQSEALIANYSQLASAGKSLYSSLTVADIEGTDIMLDNGDMVTITNSNYRAYIQKSNSPEERKDIFESVFDYYAAHKNTYANIYKTVLDADYARMKNRKYASSLESYLFNNNIPTDVYLTLTKVARENTKAVKKYLKLRKEYLKLEKHHTYDRFLELAKSDKEYEFEEAKTLFFNSIKDFPQDFQDKAHEVLRDGFVDVLEQPGKRTGAYSSSMPNMHPFILLNYDKTLSNVFTVAHEAGHSMHSMYAAESQPTSLQNYTIFVAEIASTFNEHNLLDYIIKESKASKNEKIALLQRAIDDIMGTFYRQTLFAIYELEAHKLIETDQPITADKLSQIMIDLYQEFYDIDIKEESVKEFVWAYIPHLFYTPFYVYQYATSFAASLKIYENVKNKEKDAFEKYIGLLKSGGSDYPVKQALEAGVDLTKEDSFKAVVNRLEELVDELEVVLKS